jgi:nucleic acid/nucleotide deaminase of polymorphic system toxin
MIMAMDKGEIEHVLPYIGVSKLSCIMCRHYIRAFNEVTEQKIATRGSHGKAYAGWFWPNLPSRDQELRPAFLGCMRQQLLNDFELHQEKRYSDSSVGSGFPSMELDETVDTEDGILAEFNELLRARE